MDTSFLTPIVIILIIGGISVWKIISRKQIREVGETMVRTNNQRNSDILKERLNKGEIDQEQFDILSNKIKNTQRRVNFIIIVVVLCLFAIGLAVEAYIYYTIDCNLPPSHQPSWYGIKTYTLKCEAHKPFI